MIAIEETPAKPKETNQNNVSGSQVLKLGAFIAGIMGFGGLLLVNAHVDPRDETELYASIAETGYETSAIIEQWRIEHPEAEIPTLEINAEEVSFPDRKMNQFAPGPIEISLGEEIHREVTNDIKQHHGVNVKPDSDSREFKTCIVIGGISEHSDTKEILIYDSTDPSHNTPIRNYSENGKIILDK